MTRLFESVTLGGLKLTNRIVVSPMCQYSGVDGKPQPWHTVHLGQLVVGSPGLLIVEATAVEAIGRITPGDLGLYDADTEAAFAQLLAVLRSLNPEGGTPIALQLGHAGRKASSRAPWDGGRQIPVNDGGWGTVAPSAVSHADGEEPPVALDREAMDALVARFVDATTRAKRLGFDALELHFAHGYLLHQFLSPVANRRTDDYGGVLENRMRFPLEVLAAVRATWPTERPLGIRLSATDWDSASSWTLAESTEFALRCEAAGADWIDVSTGGVSTQQKIDVGPLYQTLFAEGIRRAVNVPVIAVGLVTTPAEAESVIADGQADLVALGRAFLYDPRWVWHAAAELGESITAPPQYWRSEPRSVRGLVRGARTGQR